MLGRSYFDVRQGFKVAPVKNHLFPGINLNCQLLTSGREAIAENEEAMP